MIFLGKENRLSMFLTCISRNIPDTIFPPTIIHSKKGFDVRSYGTGSVVKLPGPAPEQPNVYAFGTTYQFMYEDLYRKDPHLYLLRFCSGVARALAWGELPMAVERSVFSKIFVLFYVKVVLQWKCNVMLTDFDARVLLELGKERCTSQFLVSGMWTERT